MVIMEGYQVHNSACILQRGVLEAPQAKEWKH